MKDPENINKIVIAVEDSPYSDQAVQYGVILARKLQAEIILIHVDDIPVSTPYVADPLLNETPMMIPEMMHIQEEASKHLFERLNGRYGKEVNFTTYTRIGRPQDEILNIAEENNADMIILGTHGRTGLDHLISGSVSESVARKSKCPVLIIPRPDSKKD